jgi:hypothetical protein
MTLASQVDRFHHGGGAAIDPAALLFASKAFSGEVPTGSPKKMRSKRHQNHNVVRPSRIAFSASKKMVRSLTASSRRGIDTAWR